MEDKWTRGPIAAVGVRRAGSSVTHLLTLKDQHLPTPSLHVLSLSPLKPAFRMFLS